MTRSTSHVLHTWMKNTCWTSLAAASLPMQFTTSTLLPSSLETVFCFSFCVFFSTEYVIFVSPRRYPSPVSLLYIVYFIPSLSFPPLFSFLFLFLCYLSCYSSDCSVFWSECFSFLFFQFFSFSFSYFPQPNYDHQHHQHHHPGSLHILSFYIACSVISTFISPPTFTSTALKFHTLHSYLCIIALISYSTQFTVRVRQPTIVTSIRFGFTLTLAQPRSFAACTTYQSLFWTVSDTLWTRFIKKKITMIISFAPVFVLVVCIHDGLNVVYV